VRELGAIYLAAFWLGAAHALEVDHMVAVGTFVGTKPQLRSAISFGVRWGLGHAAVVLGLGSLIAVSGLTVPEKASRWAELAVGAMLIAIGAWAFNLARQIHVHPPHTHGGHGHLHAHPASGRHEHHHSRADRRHSHLSTLVGAAHGLAGTAPVAALIPVTLLDDLPSAVGYLAVFGAGTVAAMGSYAALASLAVQRAATSERAARGVARLTASASVAVGIWWIVGAF
jgi:ABC-type nickel/cobalt efflux system permease component RcnA